MIETSELGLGLAASESSIVDPGGHSASVFRRFMRNRLAVAGAVVFLLLVGVAVFAPILAPYNPNRINLVDSLQSPSRVHLLGTDQLGRDALSRLIYGTRASLIAPLIALAVGIVIGIPSGLASGFMGGRIGSAFDRINEGLMSIPGILAALTIVAIFGPGLVNAMLAFGIVLIPRFYRVTRASTTALKNEVFVEASRALGASTRRVVFRHIFPNVLQPITVACVVGFASGIMAEASLSFLGVGVRVPTASWGSMLSTAARDIRSASYLVYPPGIAIALAVMSITFVGNGLHAAFGTRSSNAE